MMLSDVLKIADAISAHITIYFDDCDFEEHIVDMFHFDEFSETCTTAKVQSIGCNESGELVISAIVEMTED